MQASANRRPAVVLVSLIGVGVVALTIWFLCFRSPPPLGSDSEAIHAVDALFTAVTARDEKRLGECEERLRGYREAGKLPADAADELDAIIRKARSGSWQEAQEMERSRESWVSKKRRLPTAIFSGERGLSSGAGR